MRDESGGLLLGPTFYTGASCAVLTGIEVAARNPVPASACEGC
jgi:hypothetical protein